MKKNISKLAPLNLAKKTTSTRVVSVVIPLLKPKSFDLMLESERNEEIDYTNKRSKKAAINGIEIENVNVQIGTYANFVSAERDMPNIILLNIDLLTEVDNTSIKIRQNKEKKYSIFVNNITNILAENLCIRTRSQDTSCNILKISR